MRVTRTAGFFAASGLPIAASVMFAGVASADPPHPFGGAAVTIGCPNQGSLASLTGPTGQSGPESNPPIAKGDIRFDSFPAAAPIPAAGQVTVAWANPDTGKDRQRVVQGKRVSERVDP